MKSGLYQLVALYGECHFSRTLNDSVYSGIAPGQFRGIASEFNSTVFLVRDRVLGYVFVFN